MSTTTPTRTPRGASRTSFLTRMAVGATAALLAVGLAACGSSAPAGGGSAPAGGGAEPLTLGFAQVGAESGWRTANTKSIQDAAASAGVDLKFSDAQQKQENQIKAIRSYVQQKVDVIAFSPVVDDRLGHRPDRGQAGQHPGDPDRPGHRHRGPVALQDVHRFRLRRGGQAGRRLAGQPVPGQDRPGRHRPARGDDRLRPGDRPDQGIRGRHRGEPEHVGRRHRRPATSPGPAASR